MNILLISSYLPYPLYSGGHIRLFNLIKELSGKHKITLICEKRNYQGEAEIIEVKKFCKKVITVPRRKQWSIKNIVKTGLSPLPFLVIGHSNKQMRDSIQKELNENQFDLIHVETSYVMQNIPLTKVPIVLVEHNIEYMVYKRFTDKAPLLLKPFLSVDVLKLKYWEERMWAKAKKLIAVSEIEKKIMQEKRKDVVIVSNGVDISKFNPSPQQQKSKINKDEKRILFIGEFKWMQNRDAIGWIIREIWPKLRSEFIPSMTDKGIKLWVVGRSIPDSVRKLTSDRNIVFDDSAPKETEKIFEKADLLLAPIRVGGGTSFKILEAMASGVPVVTTSLGNAIGAKEGSEIVVAESPEDFVAGIKKILENKEYCKEISQNGRKLIEKKFNWKKIASDLDSVYESVVSYD
jgi:polysaccharide biosynthesis protein PslH